MAEEKWGSWYWPDYSYLLILLTVSGLNLTGTDCLRCYVCSINENPTFTVDASSQSFRIVDDLPQDHCRRLEQVQCDRDQDICVTIVQYRIDEGKGRPRSYSVSKGCYHSAALDLSGAIYHKRGCHKETTEMKEDITEAHFRSRRINIHPAVRYTCVCNTNRCNSAHTIRIMFFQKWHNWTSLVVLGGLVISAIVLRNGRAGW